MENLSKLFVQVSHRHKISRETLFDSNDDKKFKSSGYFELRHWIFIPIQEIKGCVIFFKAKPAEVSEK